MKISVFGLGYVGSVCAACLADEGHSVVGIDADLGKLNKIKAGQAPVSEPGLDELIQKMTAARRLSVCKDTHRAVLKTDLSIVCVGTPSRSNGAVDLRQVMTVMREIGLALREKSEPHIIVLRSTVPPGTSRKCLQILREIAGHSRFSFFYNPEFLREGRSLEEFRGAAMTVVGSEGRGSCDSVRFLWENRGGKVCLTDIETAELVKYSCNAFHATKIAFANELGRIAKGFGVDGREVMNILCEDSRLNISKTYLHPGFAFGGSCLPKDLRAIIAEAGILGLDNPLLEGVIKSNSSHLACSLKLVVETMAQSDKPRPSVLMVGIAFKAGTDDLRESPSVELAEKLLSRNIGLAIYDPYVRPEQLIGKNKTFAEYELPELRNLLQSDLCAALKEADVVIITQASRQTVEQIQNFISADHLVVDLCGAFLERRAQPNYRTLIAR